MKKETLSPNADLGVAQAAGAILVPGDHPENDLTVAALPSTSGVGELGREWKMRPALNNGLIGLAMGTHKVVFGKTIRFVPVDAAEGATAK